MIKYDYSLTITKSPLFTVTVFYTHTFTELHFHSISHFLISEGALGRLLIASHVERRVERSRWDTPLSYVASTRSQVTALTLKTITMSIDTKTVS